MEWFLREKKIGKAGEGWSRDGSPQGKRRVKAGRNVFQLSTTPFHKETKILNDRYLECRSIFRSGSGQSLHIELIIYSHRLIGIGICVRIAIEISFGNYFHSIFILLATVSWRKKNCRIWKNPERIVEILLNNPKVVAERKSKKEKWFS